MTEPEDPAVENLVVNDTPPSDSEAWADYFGATRNRPPHSLLVRAVDILGVAGKALDLGCGAGNDTRFLLDRGFRVTAVDAEREAIDGLAALGDGRLQTIQATFDRFLFEPEKYDLISAQYALPFNSPATFPAMFGRLRRAMKPGGLFTGQLFGTRDAWNEPGTLLSFFTRLQVQEFLRGLDVLEFHEVEEELALADGSRAHGHNFDIIAHRPN